MRGSASPWKVLWYTPILLAGLVAGGLHSTTATPAPAAVEPAPGSVEAIEPASSPGPAEPPPPAEPAPPREPVKLGERTLDEGLGRVVAPWADHLALLSVDPVLEDRLTEELAEGRVPWGATVVIEVKTGRVLALAQHSEREPGTEVALRALAPAASVFKIISTSALLRQAIPPSYRLCTHGGVRRLAPDHLVDDPRRDWRCESFADVLPRSSNVAMARLVDRWVPAGELRAEAERYGFNRPLAVPLEIEPSVAEIPDEAFERARAAAGFGEVRLSALHAATVAATVARRGLYLPPRLIDAVTGGPVPPAPEPVRVLDEEQGETLARMMARTVTVGTAANTFRDRPPALEDVSVAGKTGTLMDYERHVDTTWFVGFAPVDEPEIAVATVVVNDWNLWWVKALTVAERALAAYFEERPARPAIEGPVFDGLVIDGPELLYPAPASVDVEPGPRLTGAELDGARAGPRFARSTR